MTYTTLSDDGNAAATAGMSNAAPDPVGEIVTIATYQSIIEADLVRSELESRGITAYVSGATIAQTFISMPETGITVQVASSDADTGRQVVAELANSTPVFEDDDDDYDVDDASDTDLATPPGADSSDEADYEYDVNEDDEDVAQQADAAEARLNHAAEVDVQRKPGEASRQPMYDDAEAGG